MLDPLVAGGTRHPAKSTAGAGAGRYHITAAKG
jgi:hypothetical protein